MHSYEPIEKDDVLDNSEFLRQERAKIPLYKRLRTKLLLLIALVVFVTEVLVFMPSIATMRLSWLQERHQTAEAISLILINDQDKPISEKIQNDVLLVTDTLSIRLIKDNQRQDIAVHEAQQNVNQTINLNEYSETKAILNSIFTLFKGGDKVLRIIGPISGTDIQLEILVKDQQLRADMIKFSWHFLIISLTIAIVAATLIYLIIHELLIRPLQNIYFNMLDFVMEPDNPSRIIIPDARQDEVGVTQRRIAIIERELQKSFSHQKHLANLGLAVSKINHDMRNILASAQLISDHLSEAKDPMVQKLAPKLIKAIDRAVKYSHSVITYGRSQEISPIRERLSLHDLVQDVFNSIAIKGFEKIDFQNHVPENILVDADEEQLHRVITNLCRNAVQAMLAINNENQNAIKRITIDGKHVKSTTIINVQDTGNGLSLKAKQHLFSPFQGSTSLDGSGLGLAICEELIRAHGGSIKLIDDGNIGTHFEIRIPDMQKKHRLHPQSPNKKVSLEVTAP